MGKFDRKVNKKEPDAPKSMKVHKKKSNPEIAKYDVDSKAEKNRNMKILNFLNRAEEMKSGGKSKADTHLDVDKMVRN
jgi:hypothetical protein